MHRTVTALAAAAVLLLTGGCTTESTEPAAAPAPSAPPAPTVSTADGAVCAAAQRLNGQATDRYLVQMEKWVAAEDAAGRTAALTAVRRVFATWSKDLLAQAERATDPRVRIALTQYAGGVRGVIDGIESPADLERLENLDGTEIDVAAGQLAGACP